jgi:hypothetical protein
MTRDVVRVFENTPPAEIAALLESKRISAKAAVSVPPRYSTAARITPPAVGDEIRKDNHAASGQRLLGFERERDVGALGDEAGQQRRVSIGATLSARTTSAERPGSSHRKGYRLPHRHRRSGKRPPLHLLQQRISGLAEASSFPATQGNSGKKMHARPCDPVKNPSGSGI